MITNYRKNNYIIKGLIKNVSVFLPFVLLLILVNYIGDPAQLFNKNHYEQGMAEILLKGLNVAGVSNYDERFLQKHYITGLTEKNDVIVLGSSRALQVRSASFPKEAGFFNHGISGGTIEDYMAIFEMYLQKDMKPELVVLGLDPWLLNKNNGQGRWMSIGDYCEGFTSRIDLGERSSRSIFLFKPSSLFRIKKYLQIFSLSYFQSSARYLLEQIMDREEKGKYYSTDAINLDVNVKLFDGSYSYNREYRDVSISKALEYAREYTGRETIPIYSLGEFYELDHESMVRFEKFLDYLLDSDIKVVFFLSPYHPHVYDYLSGSHKYKSALEAEQYFRETALEKNIPVIGSYDPGACGLDNSDFYDAMHPKREAVDRLIRSYRGI